MDNTSKLSNPSSVFNIFFLAPNLAQVSPRPKETGEKVTAVQYDNQGPPPRQRQLTRNKATADDRRGVSPKKPMRRVPPGAWF